MTGSNRMTPSHSRPQGVRYRYYISAALLQGRADEAGSVRRVPATEIEAIIGTVVREHCADHEHPADELNLIATAVARVEVHANGLAITLNEAQYCASDWGRLLWACR